MIGININCKLVDYTGMILDGTKTVETRDSDSLRRYVGRRVGIVRTGAGVAMLVGYMTITGCTLVQDRATWDSYSAAHMVPAGSKYDFKAVKYMYHLDDVTRCDPVPVRSFGIVAREV